jgi:hypothetical protein
MGREAFESEVLDLLSRLRGARKRRGTKQAFQ